MKSTIFVTSYPYVYERYFRLFDHFPEKQRLLFILPKTWEAKGGKIHVTPPARSDIAILPTPAYFTHSHYPLIRGLLKGWMPAAARILARRAQKGDILYTAIEPNLLTTYWNARRAHARGLRHVFFTWQNVPYRTRMKGIKLWITERIIRATIRNSAGAICGNREAAEILATYVDRPDFKILVAPISGVDTERFRPGHPSDFRQEHNLRDKIVLTFAGVFDHRKGIVTLLDAYEELSLKIQGVHLVLIGTGPLEEYIQGWVQKKNLTQWVTVIPWMSNDQLPGVLATSDIFVHPSEPYKGWEEQFGYSMAEASASGVPVIATRSGSIPELILDGESGILIEPRNSSQLTAAMFQLVTNEPLRQTMGRRGVQYIRATYSHESLAAKYRDFFDIL